MLNELQFMYLRSRLFDPNVVEQKEGRTDRRTDRQIHLSRCSGGRTDKRAISLPYVILLKCCKTIVFMWVCFFVCLFVCSHILQINYILLALRVQKYRRNRNIFLFVFILWMTWLLSYCVTPANAPDSSHWRPTSSAPKWHHYKNWSKLWQHKLRPIVSLFGWHFVYVCVVSTRCQIFRRKKDVKC